MTTLRLFVCIAFVFHLINGRLLSAELPDAVSKTLATQFAGCEITKTSEKKKMYEIKLKDDRGKEFTVEICADGTVNDENEHYILLSKVPPDVRKAADARMPNVVWDEECEKKDQSFHFYGKLDGKKVHAQVNLNGWILRCDPPYPANMATIEVAAGASDILRLYQLDDVVIKSKRVELAPGPHQLYGQMTHRVFGGRLPFENDPHKCQLFKFDIKAGEHYRLTLTPTGQLKLLDNEGHKIERESK